MPWSIFCAGPVLMGMGLPLRVMCFPHWDNIRENSLFIWEWLFISDKFWIKKLVFLSLSQCWEHIWVRPCACYQSLCALALFNWCYPFPLAFSILPTSLLQCSLFSWWRASIETSNLWVRVPRSLTIHIFFWLFLSIFFLIDCKRKSLWCRLLKALTYVYI